MTNNEKVYLFCSVLKAQWVLRQCLLGHQCGNGKSGSHSCCLPHQDLVLGWHAVCTDTVHLAAPCHLLFANLWCYQDKWPLGNDMQWNDRLNLNVFELKRKKIDGLLIHSANIHSISSMYPLGNAVMFTWAQKNKKLMATRSGSFTENVIFYTWLSLQEAVID